MIWIKESDILVRKPGQPKFWAALALFYDERWWVCVEANTEDDAQRILKANNYQPIRLEPFVDKELFPSLIAILGKPTDKIKLTPQEDV